jgi:hypothetical protein
MSVRSALPVVALLAAAVAWPLDSGGGRMYWKHGGVARSAPVRP